MNLFWPSSHSNVGKVLGHVLLFFAPLYITLCKNCIRFSTRQPSVFNDIHKRTGPSAGIFYIFVVILDACHWVGLHTRKCVMLITHLPNWCNVMNISLQQSCNFIFYWGRFSCCFFPISNLSCYVWIITVTQPFAQIAIEICIQKIEIRNAATPSVPSWRETTDTSCVSI